MDTMISLPTDSTADWRNLCCADKLRLYVLAWLAAYERFTTVANDAERKGKGHVPTFLCLTLSDGSLQALAGDYYAENIRHYLLLGDHAIDSTALYRLAAQRIVASLPAPERSRFNPRHAHYHGLIHQVEAELIRRDGEIFWLQNVNYPGLVMLAQNSFYGMREEQLRRRIDNQLQRLQQKTPQAVKLACTAVQPWLFQKPVMPAVMIPAATLARMPVLTL